MNGRGESSGLRGVAIDAFLAPFQPCLERDDVATILVNGPGAMWVTGHEHGHFERVSLPTIDDRHLHCLAALLAGPGRQATTPPLVAALLADGVRAQLASPRVTRGHWAMTLRRPLRPDQRQPERGAETDDSYYGPPLQQLLMAVRRRRTVLICGASPEARFGLLDRLLRSMRKDERVIAVEHRPRLRLRNDLSVGLIAPCSGDHDPPVDRVDLMCAALRLRPGLIVLDEVVDAEALCLVRMIVAGLGGAIATIDAASPDKALERLASLFVAALPRLAADEATAAVRGAVDLVVQVAPDSREPDILALTSARATDAHRRLFIGSPEIL